MSDVNLMAEKVTEGSHTPGPWEAQRLDRWSRYDIGVKLPNGGFRLAASVDFGFTEPAESEQHANARLIAAAPDLLAALDEVVESWDSDQYQSPLGRKVREAVAKAKGEWR